MNDRLNRLGKGLLLCSVVFNLLGASHGAYPDMKVASEPNASYPFNNNFRPPIESQLFVSNDAPQIAEWTRQSNPGDTMVLTVENLTLDFARFTIYGDGVADFCDILLLDGRQCSLTLPVTLPDNTMYLLWPHNEKGIGKPVAINRTEAWWVGFDKVSRGETFYVYGRNLSLGEGSCWLYNETVGEWQESITANPYKAAFTVPETWALGMHTIYAHNGHGEKYGWSEPLLLEVEASHHEYTGNTYDFVADFGADGSDTNDDSAAWAAMRNTVGSFNSHIVNIPEGTYYFSDTINFEHQNKYVGAGKGRTVFKPYDAGRNFGEMVSGGSANWIEGITFHTSDAVDDDVGTYLFNERASWNTVVTNCEFYVTNFVASAGGFTFNGTGYAEWYDTDIHTRWQFFIGGVDNFRLDGCNFYTYWDLNELSGVGLSRNIDVSNCTIQPADDSDPSSGFGWSKGRCYVFQSAMEGFYFGGNQTIRMQPRIATPFFTGTISSITDLGAADVPWDDQARVYEFTFEGGIPDKHQGRGDDSNLFAGAEVIVEGVASGRVLKMDAVNDRVTATFGHHVISEKLGSEARLSDLTDAGNSGEQMLVEGPSVTQPGMVLSSTDTTVTVAPEELDSSDSATQIFITGGRGLGQARSIQSRNRDTGEIVLETEWLVNPDENSTYMLCNAMEDVVFYDNFFSARPDAVTNQYGATGAIHLNTTSGVVIDGNSMTNIRVGVSLFHDSAELSHIGGVSAPKPIFFTTIQDNLISGVKDAFILYIIAGAPYAVGDTWNVGTVYRRNIVSNISFGQFLRSTVGDEEPGAVGVIVFDNNAASGFGSVDHGGGSTYGRPFEFSQASDKMVLIGNTFSGNSDVEGLTHTNVVLHANNWNGFKQAYASDFTDFIVPKPVSVGGEVEIRNTGSTVLNWNSSTLGGGTISPEESVKLSEVEEGMHMITAGSKTLQIQVVGSSTPVGSVSIDFPLSGFEGQSVTAELIDQISGIKRNLGLWDSPTNITVENLSNPWYLLIVKEYDANQDDWLPVSTNAIGQGSQLH